jgi:hypothetical protein
MKKVSKFLILNLTLILTLISLLAMSLFPVLVLAQNGSYPSVLVPCTNNAQMTPTSTLVTDGAGNTTQVNSSTITYAANQQCDFAALMKLINNVINFILFAMAIPVAAIMFAYAGFLLVTAGGEAAGARTKAKNIFINVVIGLILALAAWLIVKLILSTLGYTDAASFGF